MASLFKCVVIGVMFHVLVAGNERQFHRLEDVVIAECSPGKYFWTEEKPREFYACLGALQKSSDAKALPDDPKDPGYVANAARMQCHEGTFMCRTGSQPFQPCHCQEIHKTYSLDPDPELSVPAEPTDGPYSLEHVQLPSPRGLMHGMEQPEINMTPGNNSSHKLIDKRMRMADERENFISTLPPKFRYVRNYRKFAKQLKSAGGLPISSGGCPELFRQYNNSHMFLGVLRPLTSLSACQQECLQTRNCIGVDWNKLNTTEDSRRCFFIFPESTRYGLHPSMDYCCDHFRRTYCLSSPVTHYITTPTTYETSAQPTAMEGNSAVSYGVSNSTTPQMSSTAGARNSDTPQISSTAGVGNSTTPQMSYASGARNSDMPQTSSTTGVRNSDMPQMNSSAATETLAPKLYPQELDYFGTFFFNQSNDSNSRQVNQYSLGDTYQAHHQPIGGNGGGSTLGIGGGIWSHQPSADGSRPSPDIFLKDKSKTKGFPVERETGQPSTEGGRPGLSISVKLDSKLVEIIPDTGCPFTYKRFVDRSHPFGKNVTMGDENATPEQCKTWCLMRSYCLAVDFNFETSTCYFLREINSELLMVNAGVNHYQKTNCPPPLKCWATETTRLIITDETRVTDIKMPSVECQGVCYVKQTVGTTNVIERGCYGNSTSNLGCFVDGTGVSFRTITCLCDTNRCNGLSVEALVSQMLHLPLDGDLRDHSGIGRHGSLPPGYISPTFTCLDKAVNCSALFTGNQCIAIPTAGQNLLTTVEVEAGENQIVQVPKATFVVYYKRIASGVAKKQGVFGNSPSASVHPTWAIFADNLTDTSTAGVITDSTLLPALDDFKYTTTTDNSWHMVVLTYNGKNSPLPTLQYFVDGEEMLGNSRLENGMISLKDQPVTIGCVEGLNFIGFIDEVRIFSTNLDRLDISALLLMRESNFW